MILQKTADLGYTPKRIISLVPSQTELLHYFGLEQETIGITKFCVHPQDWFKSKTRTGGTKTVNIKAVNDLSPDLIIANKEENLKVQIEQLAMDYPVWVTDVNNLDDALSMITDIGELTGKKSQAYSLTENISKGFDELSQFKTPDLSTEALAKGDPKSKTAYLIWQKPYMTVGGDTYINDMLKKCGFDNVFANRSRYPEVTIEDLHIANCQLLLLSSEPYPFKQKHIDELNTLLPNCKIILVDGEMFSWYGSRLLLATGYFKKLINGLF